MLIEEHLLAKTTHMSSPSHFLLENLTAEHGSKKDADFFFLILAFYYSQEQNCDNKSSSHILCHEYLSVHWTTLLQGLSEKPENKNVVFLKVDVDEAEVSVLPLKKNVWNTCRFTIIATEILNAHHTHSVPYSHQQGKL